MTRLSHVYLSYEFMIAISHSLMLTLTFVINILNLNQAA